MADNRITIHLEGDWSLDCIAGRFQLLEQSFRQLTDPAETAVSPVLDLAGIRGLDACGCQLLTLFVCSLRKQGIMPLLSGFDNDISSRFRQLGFDLEADPQNRLIREKT